MKDILPKASPRNKMEERVWFPAGPTPPDHLPKGQWEGGAKRFTQGSGLSCVRSTETGPGA